MVFVIPAMSPSVRVAADAVAADSDELQCSYAQVATFAFMPSALEFLTSRVRRWSLPTRLKHSRRDFAAPPYPRKQK